MSRWVRLAAVLLVAILVAAACGGDDDDATAADGEDGGEGSETADGEAVIDEPVRIVALIDDEGDDPNAVPDFIDGLEMAISEINAEGGIGGRDIEFDNVSTPAFGEEVANSFNLALERDPTVMVGPVSSSALLTIAEPIANSGIPVIQATSSSEAALSADAGSEWLFGIRTLNAEAASIAARYALEEIGAEQIGIMGVNVAFGQEGAEAQKAVIEDSEAEIVAERSFEFNATDLTEPVLAMEGADAVLDWGTPNTLALSVTTFAQQGIEVEHVIPGSIAFQGFRDAVGDQSLLEGITGVVDCNPADDERDRVGEWRQDFMDEFGYDPSYSAAQMYDIPYILKEVVESAESTSPEAIRDGLEDLDFSDGVCAERYYNVDHILFHEATVAQYQDGVLATLQNYEDVAT